MSPKYGDTDKGRFSSKRKTQAALRLLRVEDLKTLSRELGATAARLRQWRDDFSPTARRATRAASQVPATRATAWSASPATWGVAHSRVYRRRGRAGSAAERGPKSARASRQTAHGAGGGFLDVAIADHSRTASIDWRASEGCTSGVADYRRPAAAGRQWTPWATSTIRRVRVTEERTHNVIETDVSRDDVDQQRRRFLGVGVGVAAAVAVAVGAKAPLAEAAVPKLDHSSKEAQRLKYVHEARRVPAELRQEGARCSNCINWLGGDAQWGGCKVFPGKRMNRDGWCTAWQQA